MKPIFASSFSGGQKPVKPLWKRLKPTKSSEGEEPFRNEDRATIDAEGVMNHNVREVDGEILAVSQFTLFASVKKGNRPSWSRAARGDISQPMFQNFVARLEHELGRPVATGVFGADMQVSLVNDGPVTVSLDSRSPE